MKYFSKATTAILFLLPHGGISFYLDLIVVKNFTPLILTFIALNMLITGLTIIL